MVYIELKAAFGTDWKQRVPQPGGPLASDLRLTHMPTPEESPISYVTFGGLQEIIDSNWDLFAIYLPPQDLWGAKLVEVSQIRNRVAHFRLGNSDDLERVLRLMRDIDRGFWKFCTSYNRFFSGATSFKGSCSQEVYVAQPVPLCKGRCQAVGHVGTADPTVAFNVAINVLRRPWQANRPTGRLSGYPGFLYDVAIAARDERSFDYAQFLEDAKRVHRELVHVCLNSSNSSVRLTIPAVLGTRAVNETIQGIVDRVPNSPRRTVDAGDRPEKVQRLADEWPAYVLGPRNPRSGGPRSGSLRFSWSRPSAKARPGAGQRRGGAREPCGCSAGRGSWTSTPWWP
jgi:hypothetical protein